MNDDGNNSSSIIITASQEQNRCWARDRARRARLTGSALKNQFWEFFFPRFLTLCRWFLAHRGSVVLLKGRWRVSDVNKRTLSPVATGPCGKKNLHMVLKYWQPENKHCRLSVQKEEKLLLALTMTISAGLINL